MALPNPADFARILGSHMRSIKEHLEGAVGSTAPYHLRQSSGNFQVTLADAAGATEFRINDSGGNEVFSVDSDGNVVPAGSITLSNLDIPTSATPSQTAEGRAVWDSDDDVLTIGDGASRKTFYPGVASIESTAQTFVETSGYRSFWFSGPPATNADYASNTTVGLGCQALAAGSATLNEATTVLPGGWLHTTDTTSGTDCGFMGPRIPPTVDWTMVWRGVLVSAASQNVFIGANHTAIDFQDGNNIIGFRIAATGTIQGVCDNAGTETTRDSGITPDGATQHTLRIEVRSGGTIVRFYIDNAQIGADVTTNISASALYASCGIVTLTTAAKVMYTADWGGWMEV